MFPRGESLALYDRTASNHAACRTTIPLTFKSSTAIESNSRAILSAVLW